MTSKEEPGPSNGSTNGNDNVYLLVPGIGETGPEPNLHVWTTTTLPVIVDHGGYNGEQHQQDGISPPGCSTSQSDDGGNTQPVNDDRTD